MYITTNISIKAIIPYTYNSQSGPHPLDSLYHRSHNMKGSQFMLIQKSAIVKSEQQVTVVDTFTYNSHTYAHCLYKLMTTVTLITVVDTSTYNSHT